MKKTIEISDLVKVESSNISMVGFNDGTTYVQFNNGTIYSYPDTSREEFEALANAKSVGSQFSKTYRSKSEFLKLEESLVLVKDTKVEDAVRVLTEALVKDPGYRMSWQANIAMAFKDLYDSEEYPKPYGDHDPNADLAPDYIHKIANTAADNFLNLLCRDVK